MSKLVANGAQLQCSMGVAPSSLVVLPDRIVQVDDQPAAVVTDNKPNVNILPFGMCTSPSNPQVAADPSHAPKPCLPVITGPWTPDDPDVALDEGSVLTEDAMCQCQWAGVIQIKQPGQSTTASGASASNEGGGGSGSASSSWDATSKSSTSKAGAPADEANDRPIEVGDVWVRLDVSPREAKRLGERFVLRSTDRAVFASKTAADDAVPNDESIDLRFTDVNKDKTYSLIILTAGGTMTTVFNGVPYSELATLRGDAPEFAPGEQEELGEFSGIREKVRGWDDRSFEGDE